MIGYKYLNANPKGNETNDCVIRAISIYKYFVEYCPSLFEFYSDGRYPNYLEEEYEDVYRVLYSYGLMNSLMINDERNYMQVLREYLGLIEHKFEKDSIKVKELDHFYKKGNMIVNLNGHLTVIINGVLYDTVDCREEYVESMFVDRQLFL